ITLTGNQTVTVQLAFNLGIVHTGSNKLIIGPTTYVINGDASHYVDGNLEFEYTSNLGLKFDIGDPDTYAPITFSANLSSAGGVVARTDAGDHTDVANSGIDPNKSLNRTWTVSNDGIGLTGYYITFNWDNVDVDGGANPNNFIVKKYDAGIWTTP